MSGNTKEKRIVIRGPHRDIFRFLSHLSERGRRVRRSSGKKPVEGNVTRLAAVIHPASQDLTVQEISSSGAGCRLFNLAAVDDRKPMAPFRAGAYLSVEIVTEQGNKVSRPYSICNTPDEAGQNGSYSICVRSADSGFVSRRIFEEWKPGDMITVSDPQGFFTYEPLRDGKQLVFLAGGSGVTPYRSLVGDILSRHSDTRITLVQGARTQDELYFFEDFRNLASLHPDHFNYICMLSEEDSGIHRSGFIDATVLDEVMNGTTASIFICGPPAMHKYLDTQLPQLKVKPFRVRREDYGASGSPSEKEAWRIRVRTNHKDIDVLADPGETILVALERAGLNPPSSCRNGNCGFCRSRLIKGEAVYDNAHQGLRSADRELGYFHPCIAMPASDMIIEIPARTADDGADK